MASSAQPPVMQASTNAARIVGTMRFGVAAMPRDTSCWRSRAPAVCSIQSEAASVPSRLFVAWTPNSMAIGAPNTAAVLAELKRIDCRSAKTVPMTMLMIIELRRCGERTR